MPLATTSPISHLSNILVSCDSDGEAVIFLPLIFEAGNFGVHSEPVLCFGIKLLSRENKKSLLVAVLTLQHDTVICKYVGLHS